MSVSSSPIFDPADAWRVPYAETPYDLWTRTNVGEVFPEVVTPLTLSISTAQMERVFAGHPERMALIPRDLFRDGRPPAAFRVINGRVFYNTGLMHHIFTERLGFPSWLWLLSLGGPQDPGGAYLAKQPLRPLRVLRHLPALLRESSRQRRVVAAFQRNQTRMRAQAAIYRREDLAQATVAQLLNRLDAIAKDAEEPEGQLFDGSAAALNAYGMLAGLCERWCGDRALANDLVTGLATLTTAHATLALWRVAQMARDNPAARTIITAGPPGQVRERLRAEPAAAPVARALERFFDDFGHRCVDEFELAVPRWAEEPGFVISTLRAYLDAPPELDPRAHLARQRRRRAWAERRARRRMETSLLHRLVPYRWLVFRAVLRDARRLLPMRENPKHHFLLFVAELRRTVLELAERLTACGLLARPDDVFFLTREELTVAVEAAERETPALGLSSIITARRALYERYRAWQPPEAIPGARVEAAERALGETAPILSEPVPGTRLIPPARGELRGIAASSGVVTARARVALTPEEGAALEPGEVLVAPFTDPGWTPLFTVAGAVVMDLGGLLSHGAIVAREYGIPAVVNTRTATTTLRTGQLVTVDGDAGIVTWREG